jgi:hypothetical protein
MQQQCKTWMIENEDLGLMSQYELYSRPKAVGTPYRLSTDQKNNSIENLLEAAELANGPTKDNIEDLVIRLKSKDSTLRRCSAIGLLAAQARLLNMSVAS